MKTLFISLFLMASLTSHKVAQETEKITATFDLYENGFFYFVDADGYSNAFNHVSEEVGKKYDLTSDAFIGKNFQITYITETEMDESDEEIAVYTIIELKLLE